MALNIFELLYWDVWNVVTLIYISVSGIARPLNTSDQGSIETVQAPSLGTTQSGTADIYKESLFPPGKNIPQSNGTPTTGEPSDVTVLQTNNFSPTFDVKYFYPTSKLYNKPAGQQDEQADNDTESATALPLTRKGNRTNNKIGGNERRKNQVTPPVRSPVSPTLPSSTHIRHDMSEILHQNETESEYKTLNTNIIVLQSVLWTKC